MKLEDRVCSLELAKKLKKSGVPQDSYWYWQRQYFEKKDGEYFLTDKEIFNLRSPYNNVGENYSAFTVAELGEMLKIWGDTPYFVREINCPKRALNCWKYSFRKFHIIEIREANARAKLLIHLIENKLIKVENV